MVQPVLTRRAALRMFAATSAVGVAGCANGNSSFFRTAGSQLDDGVFGDATRNNVGVQSGEVAALDHLGDRFGGAVPTTINFAFDSARLDDVARRILDRQADFMRQFPEVRFSVFGHADLVGSTTYNRRLGRARAEAAVAFLGRRGVSRRRLEALVSLGETQPVVPTQTPERANRRTVTRVSGFVAGNPLVLDGKYGRIVYRKYVASGVGAAPAPTAAAPGG